MLLYDNLTEKRLTRDKLHNLLCTDTENRFDSSYPFDDYADEIINGFERRGCVISEEEYVIQTDAMRMYGLIKIMPSFMLQPAKLDNDWALIVAFRATYNDTLSVEITMGSQVLVCSNLCFHGDLLGIQEIENTEQLPNIIGDALDKLPTMSSGQENRFATFKRSKINKATGDLMLMDIYRKAGLNIQQLGIAIKEWDTPSFESHGQFDNRNGYSLWRLFNAATQALNMNEQRENIDMFYRRCQIINKIVNDFVGLAW